MRAIVIQDMLGKMHYALEQGDPESTAIKQGELVGVPCKVVEVFDPEAENANS
jgi:hypothetical protein